MSHDDEAMTTDGAAPESQDASPADTPQEAAAESPAESAAPEAPSPTPAPTPGPIPRPGPPRPVPRPHAHAHAPTQPVVSVPHSDPHRFGRVAEDGTVYLTTSAGERMIGSWQAGDAEAAFAHFGRRFDDLATEVTLMETRLATGNGDARKTKAAAAAIAESLPTASVLGDLDALATRLAKIAEHAEETAQAERARRQEQRAELASRKEALALEAEEIATKSTQWKTAGDRMRAILDEWRSITGLDRKTDEALWKRYSAARDGFNRRRGAHFSELDKERTGAKSAKERLCERAEALSSSTDWAGTAATFRDLLTEWKSVGRASKDVDDALWARFKAAQDVFFAARNAVSAERDAEFKANAEAKEKLLAEAERIDASNAKTAQAALRAITDKWDAIGKSPRESAADLDRRLKAVEKKVRDAADAGRIDPEAQARAEQFRARAEQFERQAEKAAAAGRTKEADEARASAKQWREWATAAAQALTKRR